MRPVVLTAIVLLVVLLDLPDTTAVDVGALCKRQPPIRCYKEWYKLGGNHCMKVFLKAEKYLDAEAHCRNYKNHRFTGHLVSMHSTAEWEQVMCAMYKAQTGKAHYWIGLQRICGFRVCRFVYTDQTSAAFRSWAGGQPDNWLFREHCVEMNYWSWGLWNDEACWQLRPYVCALRQR